jgi:predicted amidophosphoribosyltransferase
MYEWYNLCERCKENLTKDSICQNCIEELEDAEYLYRLRRGDIETELE